MMMLRATSVVMRRAAVQSFVRHKAVDVALGNEAVRRTSRRNRRKSKVQAAPSLSDEEWKAAALKFTSEISAAFKEASLMNNGAIENDGQGNVSIYLGEERGYFTLNVDQNSRTIDLISPVSGVLQYVHSAESPDTWRNKVDNHDIKGILVRDFLRVGCVGLPKL